MRHIGAQMFVRLDRAVCCEFNSCRFRMKFLKIGTSARGNQYRIAAEFSLPVLGPDSEICPILPVTDFLNLYAPQYLNAACFQVLQDGRGDLSILPRQKYIAVLEYDYIRAKIPVIRSKFKANIAASDNHKFAWQSLPFHHSLTGIDKTAALQSVNQRQKRPSACIDENTLSPKHILRSIRLFQPYPRDPAYASDRVGYHHWCVSVGDLTPFAAKAFEKGWIGSPEPQLGKDGNRSIWIHDPDGNALELVQYAPGSPQMQSNQGPYEYGREGLTGIAHVAFTVSDMEQALAFYREKLGFALIESLKDEEGKPWLNYLRVADGTYLELFYGGRDRVEEKDSSAGFMHMCLECGDIQETVEALRGKGAPIDVEPKQGGDKNWQAWTHDPDGNKIELMKISPESPQAKA